MLSQIAAYGGLDITAKAIFGFLFLLAHEKTIKHKLKEERDRWGALGPEFIIDLAYIQVFGCCCVRMHSMAYGTCIWWARALKGLRPCMLSLQVRE